MLRFIFVIVLALPVGMGRAESPEKELAKFQGEWVVESLEENGMKEPPEEIARFKITIKGTQFLVKMGEREESMTYKIDSAASPRSIDIVPNYGEDKGKTVPGIYEFDGNLLRICARPKDAKGERPSKFVSEKGILLMVLKKQQVVER